MLYLIAWHFESGPIYPEELPAAINSSINF